MHLLCLQLSLPLGSTELYLLSEARANTAGTRRKETAIANTAKMPDQGTMGCQRSLHGFLHSSQQKAIAAVSKAALGECVYTGRQEVERQAEGC